MPLQLACTRCQPRVRLSELLSVVHQSLSIAGCQWVLQLCKTAVCIELCKPAWQGQHLELEEERSGSCLCTWRGRSSSSSLGSPRTCTDMGSSWSNYALQRGLQHCAWPPASCAQDLSHRAKAAPNMTGVCAPLARGHTSACGLAGSSWPGSMSAPSAASGCSSACSTQ